MNLWSRLFGYQIVKTTRITDCVSVQVLPKQIQTNIRFLELQKAFEIVRRWTSDIGLLGVGVWRLHELPIVFLYKFNLNKFRQSLDWDLRNAFEIIRRWTSDLGFLGIGVWRLHEIPIVLQYKFYLNKFQTKCIF